MKTELPIEFHPSSQLEIIESIVKKKLLLESPPTKNVDEIIAQMRAAGRYSEEFLASLKDGMLDSRYFSESINSSSYNLVLSFGDY